MPQAAPQDAPLTVAEVESPIINSPFREPLLHWKIEKAKPPRKAEGRRRASYFYRVPEHSGRGRASRDQAELFESQAGEEVDAPDEGGHEREGGEQTQADRAHCRVYPTPRMVRMKPAPNLARR